MKTVFFLFVAVLSASSPARALDSLSANARLNVGAAQLAVGRKTAAAGQLLDCATSAVQHTVSQCEVKKTLLPLSISLGHRVQSATVTVSYKGTVVNMSLAFDAGLGFDVLLSDCKTAFSAEPRIQYWADDQHLYASYIWVDGESEVEITRTLKGPATGGSVRVYVSSLAGNPDLNPEDAPR
ncbi:MAG: hypothetical protein KGL74_10230 [Elusimicrobia bacterium]|nr:hypothetical protein [Elusimicrobiota bacterium]MDE2511490.1 hypothetical protein [Elusimicrobiota bacterium]